jgi:uncharacterized protein (TIGR04255 family)
MYEHETFPNAPITEAIVDFSVSFGQAPAFSDLEKYGALAAPRFPILKPRQRYATNISVKDGIPTWNNEEEKFLSFLSADEKYIAQVRVGSFAFSRLKPYISWADFEAHAVDAWEIYAKMFNPSNITKISLKYINRIMLSADGIDFSRYFKTGITVEPSLNLKIDRAFFSFQAKGKNGNDVGEVTFVTDTEASRNGNISVLFNVETIHPQELAPDLKRVRACLSDLRNFKNDLFFLSITDETKGLFR